MEGFAPTGAPEADTMKIGMACGPVNGLTLARKWTGRVDETASPSRATHHWDADRGDCFRLFAVGEATIDDLEVEVERPNGDGVLLENQSRPWVVVSEDRPFCTERDGEFVARVSTHGGSGVYALSVWRGARMVPARRKAD